jgi:fatty-acid desaturase
MTDYQKYFIKVQISSLIFLLFLLLMVKQIGITFFVFTLIFYFLFYVLGLNVVHRCISHNQFKLTKFGKILSTYFMLFTMVGDPITFSNIHRYHHRYTDTDLDPHTPTKGKFYALIGWLFDSSREKIPYSNVKDLLKDPFLKFVLVHQIKIIWITIFIICSISLEVGLALCLAMWISWIKESIGTSVFDHSANHRSPCNNVFWSWIGLTDYHKNHHDNPSIIYSHGPSNLIYTITKLLKMTY